METEVTPIATPATLTEAQKIWQEYLQKCCEVGQLMHSLDQIESQKAQIEKNLEVTQRAVKSLAAKHRENQAQGLAPKPNLAPEVTEPKAH